MIGIFNMYLYDTMLHFYLAWVAGNPIDFYRKSLIFFAEVATGSDYYC